MSAGRCLAVIESCGQVRQCASSAKDGELWCSLHAPENPVDGLTNAVRRMKENRRKYEDEIVAKYIRLKYPDLFQRSLDEALRVDATTRLQDRRHYGND